MQACLLQKKSTEAMGIDLLHRFFLFVVRLCAILRCAPVCAAGKKKSEKKRKDRIGVDADSMVQCRQNY